MEPSKHTQNGVRNRSALQSDPSHVLFSLSVRLFDSLCVKAAVCGLFDLKSPEEIAAARGKSVEELKA